MASDESAGRGQKIKLGVAIGVLVLAGVWAWAQLGGKSPADIAANRAFIDAETGQAFEYTIKRGDKEPVMSPYTHRRTGYAAEKCYWTKDENGNWAAKLKPTFVLLKTKLDPNTTEKTYCPDCGHEVVGHNPLPPKELMDAARARAGK